VKKIKLAICGAGSRGMHAYGRRILESGIAGVTAVAEPRADRMKVAREAFGLEESACFGTMEEMMQAPKMADAVIIATQDRMHHGHAIAALRAGYDILLEKPIAVSLEDCEDIAKTAAKLGRKAAVCHVLRYAPFYRAAKTAVLQGKIGDPVNITAQENVGYWHQAHSFVRGNWGSSQGSVFMLLAKCCHDLDMIVWLMGRPCERVSSFGSLELFRPERAPSGSAARCMDGCGARSGCPFDCEQFYIYGERGVLRGGGWPVNTLTEDLTGEGVREALRAGPYGRCVYACGNDAVDHQVVSIGFKGGATAALTMSGLTSRSDRTLSVMGTAGEIYGNLEENRITVAPFGREPEILDLGSETSDFSGHGGGDGRLLRDFVNYIAGGPYDSVSISEIGVSLQSHRIAFAAERSLLSGETVKIIDN